MAISDKDIELIERYLLEEATTEEKEEVDRRIHEEPAFSEQVQFMRGVVRAAENAGKEQLRKKLQEKHEQLAPSLEQESEKERDAGQGKSVPLYQRRWLYYATGIAALLIVGLFVLLPSNNTGNSLYNNYFEAQPNELVPYARGEQVPAGFGHLSQEEYNLIVRAMKHYERGNYQEASSLFEENVRRSAENAGLIVYMAISEMESGKTQQAIENLLYVNNLKEATLQDEAGWYLAMAYLKDNQQEKARNRLRDIAEESQHPYRDRASKLLKELK